MQQVTHEAYEFCRYVHFGRWASYYQQLSLIARLRPQRLLEIGVGDGVVQDYVKRHFGMDYVGADVAEDLHPDVVASVEKLPFRDGEFDLVCAFEVLEHLPFEKFEGALAELARVTRRDALVSLPHFGPHIRFAIKIPFIPEIKLSLKVPLFRKHRFNGQHYWEIGKRGYSAGKIRQILLRYFDISRDFIPFENGYHHFYVLHKKNEK